MQINKSFTIPNMLSKRKTRKKGIQIGAEKGRKDREIEVAKNLLKAKVPTNTISQSTGLPADEIKKPQEESTL